MNWRSRAGITAASVAALLCGSIGAGWAQDAPAVPARFGTHPTYDRLVLDWPSNGGCRVDQQGATATVVFDQAATLDEAQIRRDLARMAAGVTVTQSGGATTLTLQMADGVRLRHFRSGAKVVLDFSRSDAAPASPPPPAPQAASAAPAPVAPSSTSASVSRPWEQLPLSRTAASSPVSPPSPAPAAAAAAIPSERETLEQLRSLSQQLATAPPVRLTPPASKSTAASPSESVPSATAARRGTASAPSKPPAPPSGDEADAVNTPVGRNAAPPERSPAFLDAQAKRTAARIAVADARALGPPVPVRRSEGQGLRFKWPDPVTAAAFTRGPYVFLLFNKKALLDLSAVSKAPPDDLVGDITKVPSEGTAVRLAPPPDTYFAIRAEDNDWVVEMTRRPRTPDAPAEITTQNENDPAAARVRVTMSGGETVVT